MISTTTTNNPGADSARPGALDLGRLRHIGEYARAAYCPPYDTIVVDDPPTETQAVIWPAPTEIIIGLRGTDNMENWILDLDVRKTPVPDFSGVKVHAGFARAEAALLPLIFDELPHPCGRSVPITITGHSLGGALASKIAFSLFHMGFNVAQVITYASPRVGNRAWRDAYDAVLGDRTFRVVAAGDLVPLLPGVLDGYRHVGQEVYLDERIWLNPSRWAEIAFDSFRVMRALERLDVDFLLEFHSMQRDYLRLLRNLKGGNRD